MNWPSPVRSRWKSAAMTAKAALSPPTVSHTGKPARNGLSRSSPFIAISPRQALDDLVVGRLEGIGPGLAEAGDGAVDQPRVDLGQHRVAQAQAVHDARPEVLHQHVGVLPPALEDLLAFRGSWC